MPQGLLRAVCCALVLVHASAAHADTDRQTRTVSLPAGRGVTIEITIGRVTIEGSSRADADIEVVRHAPTAAGLTKIPVEIAETDTDVRIAGIQADGGTDPAYRTDITLRVPRHLATAPLQIAPH